MPVVTRRTVLVAATGALVLRPGFVASAATPTPIPNHAHGQQGSIDIDVHMETEQDVAGIAYTVTNIGTVRDTFTVSYTDQFNQRVSKARTLHLAPGAKRTLEVHGHIDHAIVVQVCSADGTCLSVGPVALVPFPKTQPVTTASIPTQASTPTPTPTSTPTGL